MLHNLFNLDYVVHRFRKPTSGSNKCRHPHQKRDLNYIMSPKYFTSMICFQFRDLKVTNSCALNKTKVSFLIVRSVHFGRRDYICKISKMLSRLSELFLCLEFGTNQNSEPIRCDEGIILKADLSRTRNINHLSIDKRFSLITWFKHCKFIPLKILMSNEVVQGQISSFLNLN